MRELLAEVIAQCDESGGPSAGEADQLYHEAKRLLEKGASDGLIEDFLWKLVERIKPRTGTPQCQAMYEKVIAALPHQRSLL